MSRKFCFALGYPMTRSLFHHLTNFYLHPKISRRRRWRWRRKHKERDGYDTPITSSSLSNERQQPQPLLRRTFDPQSKLIINWNRFLFVIRIFCHGIDLLSFFIVRVDNNVLDIDFRLAYLILSVRLMGDSFQFLDIIVKFRTAIYILANGVFKRQEFIRDPTTIAKRYFKSSFIIDFVAALPLMQLVGAVYYISYIYQLLDCKGIVFAKQENRAILGWDELLRECAIDDQIEHGMLSDIFKNKIGSIFCRDSCIASPEVSNV